MPFDEQSNSVTTDAEATAEAMGSDTDPENTEQGCRGWIAVKSHYARFNLLAVGGQITISRVVNGAATQVTQETVDYSVIPVNDMFVSRRPVPRPEDLGTATEAADGDADTGEGEQETPTVPISQAQIPSVAATTGNPLILFGGDTGYEPGTYRVTIRPEIRHGKLRIHPTAVSATESEELAGRYKIVGTDGTVPAELTAENTTDQYLQVLATTAVNQEWSQDIFVGCMPRNLPFTAEFHWADFRTWDGVSSTRLRTAHPKARHMFFLLVNKVEETFGRQYRVVQALRTIAEQDALYAQGRTRRGNIVTNARGGLSNHNYGAAIDIAEIVGGAVQWSADYGSAVEVGDAMDVEWGGRWQTIVDRPHFELRSGMTVRQLLAQYNAGNTITYDGNTYVDF